MVKQAIGLKQRGTKRFLDYNFCNYGKTKKKMPRPRTYLGFTRIQVISFYTNPVRNNNGICKYKCPPLWSRR